MEQLRHIDYSDEYEARDSFDSPTLTVDVIGQLFSLALAHELVLRVNRGVG